MRYLFFTIIGIGCGVFVAVAFPELGQPQSAIASAAASITMCSVVAAASS